MLTLFVVVKMQLLKHRNNLNHALCMAHYTQVFVCRYTSLLCLDNLFQRYQESSSIPLDKIRVYVGSTGIGTNETHSYVKGNWWVLQKLATGATGLKQARYRQGPTRVARHSYAHAQYTLVAVQYETMHGVMPASSACI